MKVKLRESENPPDKVQTISKANYGVLNSPKQLIFPNFFRDLLTFSSAIGKLISNF